MEATLIATKFQMWLPRYFGEIFLLSCMSGGGTFLNAARCTVSCECLKPRAVSLADGMVNRSYLERELTISCDTWQFCTKNWLIIGSRLSNWRDVTATVLQKLLYSSQKQPRVGQPERAVLNLNIPCIKIESSRRRHWWHRPLGHSSNVSVHFQQI